MSNLQSVKGTQDFLSERYRLFLHISDIARKIASNFAYEEIAIPIFEYTEVFKRSLGDASDIVNKEMYTFEDRKGRSITLRPEFTAPIVRSIISNSIQIMPLRLFSTGPLFRYERPQRGRYRQFHQVSFENIGSKGPMADAELISLADHFLKNLGITDVTLEINSLGDSITRAKYTEKLVEYFSKFENELSEDSKVRLNKNPLRILDSKDQGDRKLIEGAPLISDFLTKESRTFFDLLLSYINSLNIDYKINQSLVRGLDYYTDVVFEFTTDKLGAQGTIIAGGRYDNLVKQMGGSDLPAVGFGAGIERLMELFDGTFSRSRSVSIFVLGEECFSYALKLSDQIRSKNIRTEIDITNNLNKSMKKALDNNAKFIIFIGNDEVGNNVYKIKDLDARSEETLDINQLMMKILSYGF